MRAWSCAGRPALAGVATILVGNRMVGVPDQMLVPGCRLEPGNRAGAAFHVAELTPVGDDIVLARGMNHAGQECQCLVMAGMGQDPSGDKSDRKSGRIARKIGEGVDGEGKSGAVDPAQSDHSGDGEDVGDEAGLLGVDGEERLIAVHPGRKVHGLGDEGAARGRVHPSQAGTMVPSVPVFLGEPPFLVHELGGKHVGEFQVRSFRKAAHFLEKIGGICQDGAREAGRLQELLDESGRWQSCRLADLGLPAPISLMHQGAQPLAMLLAPRSRRAGNPDAGKLGHGQSGLLGRKFSSNW
jgi:hypothetical protein